MKEFEIIDHTADIGIVAYGKTKREVFINAAKGMFEIIAGENRDLKENFYAKIKLEAKSLEDLLIAWLNELLYISEVKLVILNKFKIKELSDVQIKAEVGGTKINHLSIRIKREVKAVTYHGLEIKKDEESGLWSAQVIFDI
ncbi:MAG: protein archease [Candidatus Infernicultor aquiphilus]|uniref:Protein archease n=1 Tax=Candidatus Infernicultor aquiphilus TaxID=1805029 RepID=A0A2M8CD70_9BACT|nr:MAG: protein archease [Candidatus Atribacteria bacterium CG_4_9_14_3_um_filter_33_16]